MKNIRKVTFDLVTLTAHAMLIALMLPVTVSAATQSKASKSIQLFNQSVFTNSAIIDYVLKDAPGSHKALLTNKQYLLHVLSAYGQTGGGSNHCVAEVGLTTTTSNGRNSRMPVTQNLATNKLNKLGKIDREEIFDCQAIAMRSALDSFLRTDPNTILAEVERTFSDATPQPPEPPNNKRSTLSLAGLNDDGYSVLGKMIPKGWGRQFDFREVAVSVTVHSSLYKDGTTICWATASLAAPAPTGRNNRLSSIAVQGFQATDAENASRIDGIEKCKQDAGASAMRTLFEKPWDESGIFKAFEKTREDGVPLPNFRAVKNSVDELQPVSDVVPSPNPRAEAKNCRFVRDTVPVTRFQEQCDWGTTGSTNCRQVPTTEWRSEDKQVCQ